MNQLKLSILIPTLYRRREYLTRLLRILYAQYFNVQEVEILTNFDEGHKTIGLKRNELLAAAKGDYVVFIDDDDVVTTDYIHQVLAGISSGADHIGMCGWYEPDNGPKQMFKCSKYYMWELKDNIHYRNAQHICAVKRTIAQQVAYPLISFGEDKKWADLVNPLINTEYLINTPIYTYLYRSNKTI